MKKISLLFTVLLLVCIVANAQKATVHISFINAETQDCHLRIPEDAFFFDYLSKGNFSLAVNKNGDASQELELTHPVFAMLTFNFGGMAIYNYQLYVSPGDNLKVSVDHDNKITVAGKGSENNQPLLADITPPYIQFNGDSLPNHSKAVANDYYNKLKNAFEQYTKRYHPTADFIKDETQNIKYSALQVYFCYKENNKYQLRDAYKRNKPKWDAVQDSLLAIAPLNNNEAISASNYDQFLYNFMIREKERLWQFAYQNPVAFYKEWYNTDTVNGKKQFADDMQNVLSEKIATKYFTDKVQEHAYALLIDYALEELNYANLPEVFDRFRTKFPQSKFVGYYASAIDTIRIREKRQLTKAMVFMPDNGTNINTFDELLAQMKGKTVLIDMWGTWCGPCRNQINEHADALHKYFEGKGLEFWYVANYDTPSPENWKRTISLFNIRGTHLLANEKLTKDIMAKIKGQGYPTYIIIKKDGSWELSKAGFPMDRNILIGQLNAALAQ